jgi:hypothetical protein
VVEEINIEEISRMDCREIQEGGRIEARSRRDGEGLSRDQGGMEKRFSRD